MKYASAQGMELTLCILFWYILVVLPASLSPKAPPLKTQGIKTKLAPMIASSVRWGGRGRWIEPFTGSASVALNLAPSRALLGDTNPHVVALLRDIRDSKVTPGSIRTYLATHGELLRDRGETHFYSIRESFNSDPSSDAFVFLNRASFNGIIRFNRRGRYNTPFCRKPDRFAQAYVTKIANQIAWAARAMHDAEYDIQCVSWRDTLGQATPLDFVYADPPYSGRHTDYYSQWDDDEALHLFRELRALPCGYALSMWHSNKYRRNPLVDVIDEELESVVVFEHHYHVGSKVEYRNDMKEMLVIRKGFEVPELARLISTPVRQELLF